MSKFTTIISIAVAATTVYVLGKKLFKAQAASPDTVVTEKRNKNIEEEIKTHALNPRFVKLLEKATPIPFKTTYNNGTGYFSPMLRDADVTSLVVGLYSFESNTGRMGLLIRENDHISVVFQRYTDDISVLSHNTTRYVDSEISSLNPDSLMDIAEKM